MRGTLRLSSVTYAVRAQRVLQQHGIRSYVRKVAQNLEKSGCGYGLEVVGDIQMAASIVSSNGIRVLEIIPGA